METAYAVESDHRPMAVATKKKKIGFIKRWLLNSVKEAVDQERGQVISKERDYPLSSSGQIGIQRGGIDQPERAIHFTVHVANGGRVVETRRMDRKTERSTNGLYVITNDQDFGKEIDKIITMEALR